MEDGSRVLEPSAGYGLLADGIKQYYPNIDLECVELNQDCKNVLKSKGYNVVGSDFFLFNPQYQYDYVIGAPNFRDNIDCKHVMKMYDLLKNGGTLVSIMSPYWMTGNSELQVSFREWLKNKKHVIDILPDNTFIEDGNTVPTIIIKIEKYETV
jgi:16S rRNA G1207 methylase RsmC